jgi:hypothetical protein
MHCAANASQDLPGICARNRAAPAKRTAATTIGERPDRHPVNDLGRVNPKSQFTLPVVAQPLLASMPPA